MIVTQPLVVVMVTPWFCISPCIYHVFIHQLSNEIYPQYIDIYIYEILCITPSGSIRIKHNVVQLVGGFCQVVEFHWGEFATLSSLYVMICGYILSVCPLGRKPESCRLEISGQRAYRLNCKAKNPF